MTRVLFLICIYLLTINPANAKTWTPEACRQKIEDDSYPSEAEFILSESTKDVAAGGTMIFFRGKVNLTNAAGKKVLHTYECGIISGNLDWAEVDEYVEVITDEVICKSFIEMVKRYDEQPHSMEGCLKNPNSYKKDITQTNVEISKGIVSEKKQKREADKSYKVSSEIILACKDEVKKKSKFPEEADFSLLKIVAGKIGNKIFVKGPVKLMNGLGLMIPQTFHCEYENGKITKADIW